MTEATAAEIELVETSFARIEPNLVYFTGSFYERLFETTPELAALSADATMFTRTQKIASALSLTVDHLSRTEATALALRDLGALHWRTGTQDWHYPLVRAALIETLAAWCAPNWSSEHERAWGKVLSEVSARMIEGAHHAGSGRRQAGGS